MQIDPSPNPYPLWEFPALIGDAATNVLQRTQAPDGIVGMEFLGTMAAVGQLLFKIRWYGGQERPLSLAIAEIAGSGERLSSVHGLVAKEICEFDLKSMANYDRALEQYKQELRAWKAIEAGHYRRLSQAAQSGEDTEQAKAEHAAAWQTRRPVEPKLRRIIRQKISESAIMEALDGTGESIALISDEGQIIVNGGAFENTGLLNKLWDGPSMLTNDRGNGISHVARDSCASIHFKLHPSVLSDLHKRRGDTLRGSGHWARYLMGYPASTQGTRYANGYLPEAVGLKKFHELVRELLEEYERRRDAGIAERRVLEFSEDAKRRFNFLTDEIEGMLGPWGFLSDIKDFASKTLEIGARVAALLHIFSRQAGEISVDSVNRAMSIVGWHLNEFKRLFSEQGAIPQIQRDAIAVERYLFLTYWCRGQAVAAKNDVRRSGPVRSIANLDAALDYLQAIGRLWIGADHKRKRYINLNAQHFRSIPVPPFALHG